MFKVVKPFAFSLDGFTRIDLETGDVREDFGSHTGGLSAEGYVEPFAAPAAPAPAVVAPAAEPAEAATEPHVPVSAPQPAPARRRRK